MKVYTRIQFRWTGTELVVDNYDSYEYNGLVALLCGATPAQNEIEGGQQTLFNTMSSQASTVFGASSQVFQQLQKTFAPTVAAGPNQQGFSPAEVSALKSNAITQTGQNYKNAKEAAGDAVAAQGGGNNPALQSGANADIAAKVATGAAETTANEENQIDQANYATGRQNYDTAVKGLEGSTEVFNPATSAGGAADSAGSAAAGTANQIASQNNSWMQVATGALGGLTGGLTGGLLKNIGSGSGSGGGGSAPVSAPQGVSDFD